MGGLKGVFSVVDDIVIAGCDQTMEEAQIDNQQKLTKTVLLQEGRPVGHASRALTPCEINWAQIKRGALSVLFGLERFDQYTYGRSRPVKVENDHKPPAAILRKPLSQVPKRLQDIVIRYHRYDVHFVFVKGTDLLTADTLSRDHQDDSGKDQGDRAPIMNVSVFGDIPDKRIDEIREACLLYTSPSPRDQRGSRMPSSA